MIKILIYTSIAGVIGTSLGGLIGIIGGRASNNIIAKMLSFAGGIMMGITFFDLIPESLEYGSLLITCLGLFWAVVILLLLDLFVNKKAKVEISKIKTLTLIASDMNKKDLSKHLFRTGMLMFLAIGLHNFPEGMAIGTLGAIDNKMLIPLTILIAIHNIPEGMAISVPLVASGAKKRNALILSFLAGAVTILGGIFGLLLGSINESITAFSLALAGGAMLYVTIFELIPETYELTKNKNAQLYLLLGILIGLILINIF